MNRKANDLALLILEGKTERKIVRVIFSTSNKFGVPVKILIQKSSAVTVGAIFAVAIVTFPKILLKAIG
jgi:hypothetical protein